MSAKKERDIKGKTDGNRHEGMASTQRRLDASKFALEDYLNSPELQPSPAKPQNNTPNQPS